jgi:predicted PurR-regulated permease PerM/CheY-like chemotaxis protein
MATHSSIRASYLWVLASLALTVAVIYLAKAILVPLALAVLLTFVLTPVVALVQRQRLGRVPAVLVTVILTFLLLGSLIYGVGVQVRTLAQTLPQHKKEIREKIEGIRVSEQGAFGELFKMFQDILSEPAPAAAAREVVIARPDESGIQRLVETAGPVLEPLASAGLVVILLIFMLVRREDLRNRVIGLLGHGTLTGTTRVLVDAADRLSRFLLSQLLINVCFGVIFATGLFFIGVPFAFLWGFLAAVLRFIPYLGTWVAVAFPLLLSFAMSAGWAQPVSVLVFFLALDLLTANVAEPLLFGHSTGVTPIALLVVAAFWVWVWGPIGLLLSTPLTVCLVVLGQHIPQLNFLALLLSDQPALEPHLSFYQRLLARDQLEARQVATEHVEAQGLETTFDDVLLPALGQAQRDRIRAGLTADDEQYILQETQAILEALRPPPEVPPEGNGQAPPAAAAPAVPGRLILGCAAHHEAEELSLAMLARLLEPDGCRVEAVCTHAIPAEIEARVAEQHPALVVIAVLPPGGVVEARYLCKRLRKRFKDLPIIVGYWGKPRNFDRLLVQLRTAGVSYVTTSLRQSRSQIEALVQPAAAPVVAAEKT